jgi:hypothetical protein
VGPASVLWAIVGCGLAPERGRAPVAPPSEQFVDAPDQVLPSAVVGDRYRASLHASGGSTPYTWLPLDGVPSGLQAAADGTLSGVPVEAGTTTTSWLVTDAEGRSKRTLVTLTVTLAPTLVRCGGHLEGSFRDGAWGTDGGVDLAQLDDLEWLAVDLPGDLTTRVELVFGATVDSVVWVQRAGGLVGSWDLGTYVQRGLTAADGPRTLPIDAGTDPSLTEFASQPLLPVLVAGKGGGDWTLDVVCTDGPVFETLDKYPKRLGETLEVDYQVFGDNTGVRIWTDDPLPAWLQWDESTGVVTGVVEEVGAWEFDLHARSPDGRERVERALIGTYDTVDVPCGSTAPVPVTEGWLQGDQRRRYDPRGFRVFRVPLGLPEPSGIDLRVRGSSGHYLGVARPDPGWQRFFGQAEEQEVVGAAAVVQLDSTTYPASRHFVDVGELWFTAGSTSETDLQGLEVDVRCDFDPKPDVRGLPVLDVLEPVDLQLGGIGGNPPYRWAATGLPAGLTLSADGRVTGATGDAGTHPVTFAVTDTVGVTGEQTLDWTVGGEAACLGFRELGCGDTVDGELTGVAPDDGGAGRDTWCVRDTSTDVGFVLYADDAEFVMTLSDPGITRKQDLFEPEHFTWVGEVDRHAVIGVPFDAWSFPWRPDYLDRPVFVSIWATDPGTYTLELECPEAPGP